MDNKDTKKPAAETKTFNHVDRNNVPPVELAVEPVKSSLEPVKQAASPLSPEIMAAITATVSAAMQPVLEMLKRPTQAAPAPQPQQPATASARPPAQKNPRARIRLEGIPVQEGQDMRDVHPHVIKQWFETLEQRWRAQHNAKAVHGKPVEMNWTRG